MAAEISWLGLADNKVQETTKNIALTTLLKKIVDLAKAFENSNGCSTSCKVIENKQKGYFLYQLGTKLKPQSHHHLPLIVKHIMNGDIRNDAQFKAATDYLLAHSVGGAENSIHINEDQFKQSCGAGVITTADDIEDKVKAIMEKHKQALITDRYSYNVGKIRLVFSSVFSQNSM
uniref:Glutaminyl-tRNA synthetase class Ib non-specific RNA-binding domain-containing protein n=1 Tax=Ditylenchus dipsaci TaxID=166011 RepID=A0A915EE76_9BILA